MSDIVVTVPKWFWFDWIDEGDAAGESETGEEWAYYGVGPVPRIVPGERVYIVAHDRVRGYAPLTRLATTERGWALCRRGGAVAVTIDTKVQGFRMHRTCWWHRSSEKPFPDWKTKDVVPVNREQRELLARLIAKQESIR